MYRIAVVGTWAHTLERLCIDLPELWSTSQVQQLIGHMYQPISDSLISYYILSLYRYLFHCFQKCLPGPFLSQHPLEPPQHLTAIMLQSVQGKVWVVLPVLLMMYSVSSQTPVYNSCSRLEETL